MKKSMREGILFGLLGILAVLFLGGSFAVRQQLPALLGLLLMTLAFDLWIGSDRAKWAAWTGILLGYGWEAAMGMSGSGLVFFQKFAVLERFSWFFLACLAAGYGLRIRIARKTSRTKGTSGRSGSFAGTAADFLGDWGIELLILLVTALSLRMLVPSGYYWDDALNSTAYLFERQDGIPLIRNLLTFMGKYLALGRINVLSAYYYLLFYVPNVTVYKMMLIGFVLLSQLAARFVLTYLSGSRKIGQLTMAVLPLLIQLRVYQDPVSGFYGLMQMLVMEILFTAYFLTRYLRLKRGRDLLFSLIAFTAGCMTYEVVFPFLLMIPLLCWAESCRFRRVVQVTLPYFFICLLLLAAILILRLNLPTAEVYEGVRFEWNLSAILRGYGVQLLAALPLSYYTFTSQLSAMGKAALTENLFRYASRDILLAADAMDYLLAGLLVISILLILRKTRENPAERSARSVWALGLCLFFLPALTIAFSSRYQGQLIPGLGYLPVFISIFGSALLLIMAAGRFSIQKSSACFGLTLALIGVIFLVNTQHNRIVTQWIDRVFYYPRLAGERALQEGIFDFLPEDATVISMNPDWYLWEASWDPPRLYGEFNTLYSGRDFVNGDLSAGGREEFESPAAASSPAPVYLFSYSGNELGGIAALGKLSPDRGGGSMIADEILYYLDGPRWENSVISYIDENGTPVLLHRESYYPIRYGAYGTLYQLDPDEAVQFSTFGAADLALQP